MKIFQRITVSEFCWRDFFAKKLEEHSERHHIDFVVAEHYNGLIDCLEGNYNRGQRNLPPFYYNLPISKDHKHVILYLTGVKSFSDTALFASMMYYQRLYTKTLSTYDVNVRIFMGKCYSVIQDKDEIQSHWGSELNILYSNLKMNEIEVERISRIFSGDTNGNNDLFQI